MSETDLRFEAKESTVPAAGFGLFAREKIAKGDYLEIIGVKVPLTGVEALCTRYADTYKFAAEPEHSLQHAVIPLGFAALVNHADAPGRQNVAIAHLPPERTPRNPAAGQVVYMALRDIDPGEEVLTHYNRKGSDRTKRQANELLAWKQLLETNFYNLGELVDKKAELFVPDATF